MIKKYRKKPIVVEALQFKKIKAFTSNLKEVREFIGESFRKYDVIGGERPYSYCIETLEGDMEFHLQDWIVKGINGEFYPVKDDIFKKTYEEAIEEGEQ